MASLANRVIRLAMSWFLVRSLWPFVSIPRSFPEAGSADVVIDMLAVDAQGLS